MKPVPSVLLIAAVLLYTHIPPSICRPRDLSLFDRHDDYKNQLDEVLLRAGKGEAMSFLSGGTSRGHALRNASRSPTLLIPNSLEELVGFTKRNDDPPISIDLTFHLLRNMIEMARIENQREQAELNRKYLDEVGK
ncbi:urotensin 1 [Pangasianodon hypophthalmus]|uniref:urotensin 1 n=1 Tax=Pangasianodon hypophthalmus TaxID=310915 RepID=UPI000F0047E2|nr:urotensin 1 [Pangasianodon hypophthalmus]